MLVILFLILITIHGSVDGPSSRGFSYLEVWYTGMFVPVVIAIIEYAFILAVLKYRSESQYNTEKLFRKMELRRFLAHIDMIFLSVNAIFLAVFIPVFFSIVPTSYSLNRQHY